MPYGKLSNIWVKDVASYAWFVEGWGTMIGCLVQDVGVVSTSHGEGQVLYSQNDANGDSTLYKTITACFFIAGYRGGMQIYGSGSSHLDGYRVTNSVFYGGEVTCGNSSDTDDIVFDGCVWWGNTCRTGYNNKLQKTISLTNCLADTLYIIKQWNSLTWTHGIIIRSTYVVTIDTSWTNYAAALTFNNNVYISPLAKPFSVDGTALSLSEWQAATGQDADAKLYTSVALHLQITRFRPHLFVSSQSTSAITLEMF